VAKVKVVCASHCEPEGLCNFFRPQYGGKKRSVLSLYFNDPPESARDLQEDLLIKTRQAHSYVLHIIILVKVIIFYPIEHLFFFSMSSEADVPSRTGDVNTTSLLDAFHFPSLSPLLREFLPFQCHFASLQLNEDGHGARRLSVSFDEHCNRRAVWADGTVGVCRAMILTLG